MFDSVPVFIGLRYLGAGNKNQLVAFLSRVSMLGLVLGVALLITVLSVMNGFDRELRERILAVVPHVSIYNVSGIEDWPRLVEEGEQVAGVSAAAPFIHLQGMLMRGQKIVGVMAYGIDVQSEEQASVIGDYMVDGSFSSLSSVANGVVISQKLADKLSVTRSDRLTLVVPESNRRRGALVPRLVRLEVAAIYDTGTELDNGLIYMNLSKAMTLWGDGKHVEGVRLQLDDLFAVNAVTEVMREALPPGAFFRDWRSSHGNLYQAIQLSRNLVGMLLFIIIAVAAFNVVTTLIMVVMDKQDAIAILQTLGLSPRQVMLLFMIYGTFIGMIGAFVGFVLGCLLSYTITPLVAKVSALFNVHLLQSDVYPVSYLPSDFRLEDGLLVASVAIGMCFLATIYPSWRAAKTLPAEALRYE
ncbi:lipoprotein-releasing system permease protein [Sinobacterium caligoides]|uniref:Lipoprotein-releasing system permease protein n=1 Tax=Sinobacterium caligoides TaxID=933926 RepID=A0A3N2DKT2_9GAMM|nr:lipoprotein-releasing ABC transporter permease subunit [Sinobacterium caligoides]ROS00289.1 lipoprotein-releasing system permease protein [Sinobacterium caligoides]